MVIYAFLLGFFSPHNQKNVTSKSRALQGIKIKSIQNQDHKQLTQNKHYIAQTSKVQKDKAHQS